MSVYVCVCESVCVCVSVYVCVSVCVSVYVCVSVRMHVCMCVCVLGGGRKDEWHMHRRRESQQEQVY